MRLFNEIPNEITDIEDLASPKPKTSPALCYDYLDYFKELMLIKADVLELCSMLSIKLIDENYLHLNPLSNQIQNNGGIALRFIHGKPVAFCTPIGELSFADYEPTPMTKADTEASKTLLRLIADKYGLVAMDEISDTSAHYEDDDLPICTIYALMQNKAGTKIAIASLRQEHFISDPLAVKIYSPIFDELRYLESTRHRWELG